MTTSHITARKPGHVPPRPLPPRPGINCPDCRVDLQASADLVRRVEREAREATALPWWFWEAAVVLLVLLLAWSAAQPYGLAPEPPEDPPAAGSPTDAGTPTTPTTR